MLYKKHQSAFCIKEVNHFDLICHAQLFGHVEGTGFPRLAIRKEGLVEGKHIGTTVHASFDRQNTAFYGLINN